MTFVKGHKESPGRQKGSKNQKTIAKEDARKVFEEAQLKFWGKITEAQAKRAIRNSADAQYTINQVIGKPKDTVDVGGEVTIKLTI